MPDPFDLQRFVTAQKRVYANIVAELRRGHKESHWMWFVFPQMRGLGQSYMAHLFGITALPEAEAYLAHTLLGPRLRECTELMLAHHGKTAFEILGPPDDLKFRSSITLFERAAPDEPIFGQALDQYFGGERDRKTLELLAAPSSPTS